MIILMRINDIIKSWKEFIVRMNDKGIPVPMVRDPQSLEGSVSLTLVVISSTLVVAGILSKWAGLLGGVDMNSAFNFFYASTTLYFGHSWINKDSSAKADDPDAK